MKLLYEDIKEELEGIERPDLIISSAVEPTNFLTNFVQQLKPHGIIEIGTYKGISTAVLASISKHVYTFDIAYRDVEYILDLFHIRHKVSICVAPQEQIDFEINTLVNYWNGYWKNKLNFNFAFVDGKHEYESVKHDFSLVKFTGRVLFHDASYEPIKKFLNEIPITIVDKEGNFGYWQQ